MQGGRVVGRALEVVAIEEAAALDRSASSPFSPAERSYAESKTDPERRLAARLAAKRAAVSALGGGLPLAAVEVRHGWGGPPTLRLSDAAQARMRRLGADAVLVSLTHGLRHAAASVLLLRTE